MKELTEGQRAWVGDPLGLKFSQAIFWIMLPLTLVVLAVLAYLGVSESLTKLAYVGVCANLVLNLILCGLLAFGVVIWGIVRHGDRQGFLDSIHEDKHNDAKKKEKDVNRIKGPLKKRTLWFSTITFANRLLFATAYTLFFMSDGIFWIFSSISVVTWAIVFGLGYFNKYLLNNTVARYTYEELSKKPKSINRFEELDNYLKDRNYPSMN